MSDLKTKASKGGILVVDDTPSDLCLLRDFFTDQGFDVRAVSSGRAALQAAVNDPPEIVLLGVRLPDMAGYEVCERLKADEDLKRIPILFIGALDETRDKVKGVAVGGADYIIKPFELAVVLARVETQLTIARLKAQLASTTRELEAARSASERLNADLEGQVRRRTAELEEANETLREIKAQFEAVYNHHYQMTGLIDREGRLLMGNRTALEFAGVQAQDVVGRYFWETPWWTHSPEAQRMIQEAMGRAMSGEKVHFEATHISAAGETKEIDVRIRPVFDDNGEVIYLVPEGYDITERKRAEEELREREEMIRALVETSREWIWSINLAGTHTYCNPAIEAILGYRPEELVGKPSLELLHEEDRKAVESMLTECIASKQGWTNLLLRWQTKDGDWRFLESNAVPMLDDKGDVVGFRGVDRDITARKQAEEALRESEEKYRTFFENSCDAMMMLHNDQIVGCNAAAAAMLGYEDAKDLLQTHPAEISPEYQSDGKKSYDEALAMMAIAYTRGTHRFEWEHITRDGDVFPVEVSLTAIPSDGGRRLLAVWRDIVDRRQAEQSLRRQTDFDAIIARILARFARSSAAELDNCIIASLEEMGRFIGVDSAFVILLDPDQTTYGVTHNWVTPGFHDYASGNQNVPMGTAPWNESKMLAGEIVSITSIEDYPPEADAERWLFERDGVRSQLLVPLRGREGQVAGCVGFRYYKHEANWIPEDLPRITLVSEAIANVLERKRAETSLQHSEERYRSLVSTMQDIIYSVSADGSILFIGPQVERYGFTLEELVSQPFETLIVPEDRDAVWRDFQRTLATGEQTLYTFRAAAKEAGVVWFEEIGRAVYDDAGNIVSISGMLRDISERKKSEAERENLERQLRQAQRMEAIGQLAGGVAHDFNNLLQAILGYGELALRKVDPENRLHADLEQIVKAGKRAAALVRQLLAFSRKQVLRLELLDLNEVVEEFAKMIRRVIGEHIALDIHFEPGLKTVHADRGQLEQILMNLCVNSRDAMPEGGRLTITTDNVELGADFCRDNPWAAPGNYVQLSVSDTGIGMDEETQQHVFEPFYTTKGVGEGTGLGLATVYGIVRQHQGMISVHSEPGFGATFRIYLPMSEPLLEAACHAKATDPPGGTEVILLAEDDEGARNIAILLLEDAGYTVIAANDGQEAIRLFERHAKQIDLALLDVVMPGCGGRAVYDHIRKTKAQLPVLFASGYSAGAIHTNFVLEEGIELIQKPYQRDEFLREVRRLLDA